MNRDPSAESRDGEPSAQRHEPGMGAWERLHFERTPRASAAKRRRHVEWTRWIALAAVVLVIVLLLMRGWLADRLWPPTRAETLAARAQQALQQGRLSAADGSGARELYEAAIAVDPDNQQARSGLARVGEAAVARGEREVAAGQLPQARRDLELAQAVAVPVARSDALATRLREREAQGAGIAQLLARAEQARAEGRLDGDADAALPLYQLVLTLQPDNNDAIEGRDDAVSDLLQQARAQLAAGDFAKAAAAIAAARRFDAGHGDLPDAESRLIAAQERLRRDAAADVRDGDLAHAERDYDTLLAIDPADPAARDGRRALASAYTQRAQRDAADFRFAEAQGALDKARSLDPHAPSLVDAERSIARARQSKLHVGGDTQLPPRVRSARVDTLLKQAAAAEARGQLVEPPGDSAFDKLRAARALAPDDARVVAASTRLLPLARDCFAKGLRANDLGRARACLDARAALEGDGASIRDARRRLAQRWIAVGNERLGAGDLHGALDALGNAREIDATTPGIATFAARLRVAQGGASD